MKKISSIILILFLSSCSQEKPVDSFNKIAANSLIIDTHIDAPHKLNLLIQEGLQIHDLAYTTSTEFDYPKAEKGGLNVAFMSIYLPAKTQITRTSFEEANKLIDVIEDIITLNPSKFLFIKDTKSLDGLIKRQKVGLALGMENGAPLEGKLERVKFFYERGIRYITLTHSRANHISDSSYDSERVWGGLSDFGKQLIPEMNRVGIMIDISHVSDEAFYQSIELSNVPLIASHSSLRHFTPGFERNVSDDMLIKLAEKGGVIQINFGSTFLTKRARAYSDASQNYMKNLFGDDISIVEPQELIKAKDKFQMTNGLLPFASIDDVVDHIDRVVNLVGIDHVGLGSDFDGVGDSLPTNLKDVSMYPNLIRRMLERGHSEADIKKVLGGNLRRVWSATEQYANKFK
tara:strand:+ start:7956 stop:9164 length:1209 start_codon:yes stop_codon:yes gene_type:complete